MSQTTENKHITKWNLKTKNIGNYKVIFIEKFMFDLFWGNGWENQARFTWDKVTKQWRLYKKFSANTSLPRDVNDLISKL